jgi:hypothetical protein
VLCAIVVYFPMNKYVGHISSHTPPIVYVEDFDLSPRLSLCMCFEAFEMLKNLRLLPEKIHPSVS